MFCLSFTFFWIDKKAENMQVVFNDQQVFINSLTDVKHLKSGFDSVNK